MAVPVSGNISNVIYAKGDTCLKISPFDNYRMFTLYQDWTSDDRKPLNLSGGDKLFLVFKGKNKEIRIPEYDTIMLDFTVDKANGQVLFKISQKNAIDILSIDTRVFYITRVFETYNLEGNKVVSSDEEVLYTGQWSNEGENIKDYTSQIKKLMDLLAERNKTIQELQTSNAQLIEQNVNFAAQIEDIKSMNEQLTSQVESLSQELGTYQSGTEYQGVVIGEGKSVTVYTQKTLTEEQLLEKVKEFNQTQKE